MRERPKKLLGELLIEDGVLSRENLTEALGHQKTHGGLIGQILIRLGYVSEEDLIAALARQLSIPYITLANYSTNVNTAVRFNEEFCRRNLLVAFDEDDRHIFISMADPLNSPALEEIEKQSQLRSQVFISTPSEILNMLDLVFSSHYKKKDHKG